MSNKGLALSIGVVLLCQILAVVGLVPSDHASPTRISSDDPSLGWGYPALIENEEVGDAMYPSIDMNDAGYGVAVWEQSPELEGVVHSIWANRYSPLDGWAGPEQISSTPEMDCSVARAAVDPQGNIFAVWTAFADGAFSVWSTIYSTGTGWGDPQLIDPNPTESTLLANVVCDRNGNALALWIEYGAVKSSWYVPGVGWGPKESVSTHGGFSQPASFGVDAQGNAIAVWYDEADFTGTIQRVWSNRYVAGVGWGNDELLMASWGVNNARVAVDDAGNAVAVWLEKKSAEGFAPSDTWASKYTIGTGWSTPEVIDSGGTRYVWSMNFAGDGLGNSIVVWEELDDQSVTFHLLTMKYTPSSGWGAKVEVDAAGYSPNIDINHDGLAFLVWLGWDDAMVWSSRCTPESDWTTPELVGTEGSQDLRVAVDGSGGAIVVWMTYYYTQSNIYGNEYRELLEAIGATVVIQPEAVNPGKCRWITAYIDLPKGYSVGDIIVDSVRLNGQFAAVGQSDLMDFDKDKVKELMVKFDAQQVFGAGAMKAGQKATLTVSGWMTSGELFEGSDTVTVLSFR